MRRLSACVALLAGIVMLAGCGAASGIELPSAGGSPDYQLGGAYDPPEGVEIVARDRSDSPADGVYSICYVNGFQTQPSELDDWPENLLLRDEQNNTVFDPNWPDEALLDTSSAQNREAIAAIVGAWIAGCAADGYDAVEFDNLDTYARSNGLLTFDANLDLAKRFVDVAHEHGLAAGQKNAAEDARRLKDTAGFDFAIAEECAAFDECDAYSAVYGEHVIDVEYGSTAAFDEACTNPATPASTVLRDRELRTPQDDGYVFALCP